MPPENEEFETEVIETREDISSSDAEEEPDLSENLLSKSSIENIVEVIQNNLPHIEESSNSNIEGDCGNGNGSVPEQASMSETEKNNDYDLFFNSADPGAALKMFKSLVHSENIHQAMQLSVEGACSLDMGKIEKGPTSREAKTKSLQQHWFSIEKRAPFDKKQPKHNKEGKNSAIFVERNSLIS
eukprot:9486005-Ditylum_brightwellii.AAC.1